MAYRFLNYLLGIGIGLFALALHIHLIKFRTAPARTCRFDVIVDRPGYAIYRLVE